jgi:hypothetical protein
MKMAKATRTVCYVLVLLYMAACASDAGARSGTRRTGRTRTTSTTRKVGASRSSGLTSAQRRAARSALTAIRKLESATKAGICYEQYHLHLDEAQEEVDGYLDAVPQGAVKSQIEEVMNLYVLALQQWQGLAENPGDGEEYENTGPSPFAKASYSVSAWWRRAREATRRAERLLR